MTSIGVSTLRKGHTQPNACSLSLNFGSFARRKENSLSCPLVQDRLLVRPIRKTLLVVDHEKGSSGCTRAVHEFRKLRPRYALIVDGYLLHCFLPRFLHRWKILRHIIIQLKNTGWLRLELNFHRAPVSQNNVLTCASRISATVHKIGSAA